MNGERAEAAVEQTAYTFRPSLLGAPRAFKLAGDGIDWVVGRRSGTFRFAPSAACACRTGRRVCSRSAS